MGLLSSTCQSHPHTVCIELHGSRLAEGRGQGRAGQGRAGQGRAGQGRAGAGGEGRGGRGEERMGGEELGAYGMDSVHTREPERSRVTI